MRIGCSLLGHKRPAERVWNDGLYFGRCPRCDDVVISANVMKSWRSLPRRLRVVWKRHGPHALDWYDVLARAPRRRPLRRR